MSATEETVSRPKKRIGLWVLSLFAVVVVAILIGLPYLIKNEAIKWLESHGADKAHIDDVDLNLFAGTFQVDNLFVQNRTGTPLRIWQLAGDINWVDLLDKRVVVQSLWVFGSHLSIVQGEDDALSIGGIQLPKSLPDSEITPESAPSEKSDWTFGLNTFVLADALVEYRAPRLEQDVYVNVVYVFDTHSWEPDHPARVGVDMRINNQPFKITSEVRPFADDPDTVAHLELEELNLDDFAALAQLVDVKNLSGTVSLKLALDGIHQDKTQTRLGVRGDLFLRELRADYTDMSIVQGLLHYTGAAKLVLDGPAGVPLVDVEGQWKSEDSSFTMGDLNIKHAGLIWETATKVFSAETENGPMEVHTQGEGGIDSLIVDDTKLSLRLVNVKHVDIQGADVKFPERATVKDVIVDETTVLESMTAKATLPEVRFKQLQLGQITYDFAKKEAVILSIAMDGVNARDKAKNLVLADVGKIAVKDVRLVLEKGVAVARIDIVDVNALQPVSTKKMDVPAVVAVGKTTVQKIDYMFDPPRLVIDSVDISKLNGVFIREVDGAFYGLAQLMPPNEAKADAKGVPSPKEQRAVSASAEEKAMTIRLGSLKIANAAEIHWMDNFVKPRVDLAVNLLSLSAGPFDTAEPETKTHVELLASLEKFNEIKFKGHVSPLDPKPSSKLDGSIKGLDMTDFSSYASAAGYTLRSGRLDAEITAKVTEGELDMLNKLVITNLRLEGGGGEVKRDATGDAAALPLNVALDYLRDSKDRIKLDVPITGNLRNPQFSFIDVYRLAIQSAAKQSAMSYITAALQPLGTVMLVAKLVGKAANVMQLKAIEFKPGDAALDDTAQAYAEKMAAILNNRPAVKLTVCGNATESDRAFFLARLVEEQETEQQKEKKEEAQGDENPPVISDDQLLQLAHLRSKQVRDLLVDKHKINPDQIFDCRPALSADASAVPSVALGM